MKEKQINESKFKYPHIWVKEILTSLGLEYRPETEPLHEWIWNVHIREKMFPHWIEVRQNGTWKTEDLWYGATIFGFHSINELFDWGANDVHIWYINPNQKPEVFKDA